MAHFKFSDFNRLPFRMPAVFTEDFRLQMDLLDGIDFLPANSLVRCYGTIWGVTLTDAREGQLVEVQTTGFFVNMPNTKYTNPFNGQVNDWILAKGDFPNYSMLPVCPDLEVALPSNTTNVFAVPNGRVVNLDPVRGTFDFLIDNASLGTFVDNIRRSMPARPFLQYSHNVPTSYRYGSFDADGNPIDVTRNSYLEISDAWRFPLRAQSLEAIQQQLGIGGGSSGGTTVSELWNYAANVFTPADSPVLIPFESKIVWDDDEFIWDPAEPEWIEVKPTDKFRRLRYSSGGSGVFSPNAFIRMVSQYFDGTEWQPSGGGEDFYVNRQGDPSAGFGRYQGFSGQLKGGWRYAFEFHTDVDQQLPSPNVELYAG